jgi:hypothetical protein
MKLTLAWRIGLPHWETAPAFRGLLRLVRERRPIIHELALFDSITHHQYIPLPAYAVRMKLLAGRIRTLHREGVRSVGANVLCTLGHIDEAWSCLPPLPYQKMVGHDGSVAVSCACPNSPALRRYVRAKYELVASAAPDFIWVDDDIRMHHRGVAWGCFCPTCLERFSRTTGRRFTREKLGKAFDEPGQGALRQAWIEQNIAMIESLLADIADAVHEVNPGIALGLMTAGPAWTTYSGMAFKRWFSALRATKARPGGGFYTDATPGEMIRKGIDCGWQRSALPATVTDIQDELENFPYQVLKKSATAVVNECTLALAHGLNGIAFNCNALTVAPEDFLPLLERIADVQPQWRAWVTHAAGLPTAGLWPAWSSQLMAKRAVRPGERWLDGSSAHDITRPFPLAEIGLPIATDAPGCGTVLSGRVAEMFSTAELKEILAGGVLLDSTALTVLTERRLGSLTGVRLAKRLDNGVRERFTKNALNGRHAGHVRDARIEFWGNAKGQGDVLAPVARGVRVLSVIEDYNGGPRGPGMTAFENSLGGRVVVMGYAPWIFLHSVAKRHQLQNATDWLSRGQIPVRVDEPVRLVPVVRTSANGERMAILLMNAGLDEIREATVHIRTAVRSARWQEAGKPPRSVRLRNGTVVLRDIPPWSFRMILLGGAS